MSLLKRLTHWIWAEHLAELRDEKRAVEKHRDAILEIYKDEGVYRSQLQDENQRLRNLCLQMRLTFRRIKRRSMNCTPYNWPNIHS